MKKIVNRMQRKTPAFFKQLRTTGAIITAAGLAIVCAPYTLPTLLINVAGYVATAGAVITAVSQTAVKDDRD